MLRPLLESAQLEVFCLVRMREGAGPEIAYQVEWHPHQRPPITTNSDKWLPWVAKMFAADAMPRAIHSIAELSPTVRAAWKAGANESLRSVLLLPAGRTPGVRYAAVFGSACKHDAWSNADTGQLKKLAESVASVISRNTGSKVGDQSQRFEQLMSSLLRGFGAAHWTEIDAQIERALEDIRSFFDVDQCGLVTVAPGESVAVIAHLASRELTVPVGFAIDCSVLAPWVFGRLVNRREKVAFSRREDLPAEAAVDRRYLESVRTHAAVYVPYALDGQVRFIFTVVNNHSTRIWPQRVVEQIETLGAAFLSPIRRKTTGAAGVQAQEQLVTAQHFSQATLDALHKHIAVIDVTGGLIRVSDLWGRIGGHTPCVLDEAKVGNNYLASLEAAQGPLREQSLKLAEGVRSVLSGEVPRFDIEVSLHEPKAPRWLHIRVQQFVVHRAVFAAVSYEDATQRRLREQELQLLRDYQWHSDRVAQTGVLIASLAHELSQPMAAILINAQTGLRLLSDSELAPQLNHDILGDIVADCKRAGAVIESLRIMLRRQKSEQKPEDVADVVRRIVRLLHREAADQSVQITERYQGGCVVTADRAQIQQVALNLIVNAIESMADVAPERRRVWIRVATSKENGVLLSVRDSGVGITQEQTDKVFDAFWTTKARGTGMGLAICQAIVETHGGTIWVKRNKVGSTFYVALPLAREAVSKQPPRRRRGKAA